MQAITEIEHLKKVLISNVDFHHRQWFTEIEEMCHAVGTIPSLPRTCGRQTHRSNIEAETPSQYYRQVVTIPFLDHIISEINSRFSQHQQTAYHGLCLIPSVLVEKSMDDIIIKHSVKIESMHKY